MIPSPLVSAGADAVVPGSGTIVSAITSLLGFGGGGGGQKPGEVLLTGQMDGNGRWIFGLGNNNLPDRNDAANEAYLAAASGPLNDPNQYDPDILRQLIGTNAFGVGSAQEGASVVYAKIASAKRTVAAADVSNVSQFSHVSPQAAAEVAARTAVANSYSATFRDLFASPVVIGGIIIVVFAVLFKLWRK